MDGVTRRRHVPVLPGPPARPPRAGGSKQRLPSPPGSQLWREQDQRRQTANHLPPPRNERVQQDGRPVDLHTWPNGLATIDTALLHAHFRRHGSDTTQTRCQAMETSLRQCNHATAAPPLSLASTTPDRTKRADGHCVRLLADIRLYAQKTGNADTLWTP